MALDDPWIVPMIVVICLFMDIAFIKPKNFKYAYKSYLKHDHHDDNYIYQQTPAGTVLDPEAQYRMNGAPNTNQPGMMMVQPG